MFNVLRNHQTVSKSHHFAFLPAGVTDNPRFSYSQSMLSNFYGSYFVNFTFCSFIKILSLVMSALVINSFGFSRYIVITPAK